MKAEPRGLAGSGRRRGKERGQKQLLVTQTVIPFLNGESWMGAGLGARYLGRHSRELPP